MNRAPNIDETHILACEADLRSFVKRRISHPEDAADVCARVLMLALAMLPRFEGRSHPRTWLFSIAHNTIADYYRKKKTFVSISESDNSPKPAPEMIFTQSTTVQDRCDARERIESCLQCVIANLSLEGQVAILLCEIYATTDRESARALGTSLRTFKRILHDARTTLHGSCDGMCGLVAKTGSHRNCSLQLRRRPAPIGVPRMANGVRLMKVRNRLVREILFFDGACADRLIVASTNGQ